MSKIKVVEHVQDYIEGKTFLETKWADSVEVKGQNLHYTSGIALFGKEKVQVTALHVRGMRQDWYYTTRVT